MAAFILAAVAGPAPAAVTYTISGSNWPADRLAGHYSGTGELFQLDGQVTVASASTVSADQGSTNILAKVIDTGRLTVGDTGITAADNGFVRLMAGDNTFAGELNVIGRFELASGANHTFIIGANGINNAITGPTAKRVLLNGAFDLDLDLTAATTTPGAMWPLVTAANVTYGSTFALPGFTETAPGLWTNGGYAFSEATGRLTFVPEPATLALVGLAGLILTRRRTTSA